MDENNYQINIALGFMQQRDGASLTRFLIRQGSEFLHNTPITVLEVVSGQAQGLTPIVNFPGLSFRRFDTCETIRPDPLDVAGVEETISSNRPTIVDTASQGTRLLVPSTSRHGPMRLVIFDNLSDSPMERTRALQIAELYGHQIELLDSRERDNLTGLLNRQTFDSTFQCSVRDQELQHQVHTLAIMDIDFFKRVNDTYGHLHGDKVLMHFAKLMKCCFRFSDPLYRFGGEEFVALLTTDEESTAIAALQRFRKMVEAHWFPSVGKLTVSVGVTSYQANESAHSVIERADQALYQAKRTGRNRLVQYQDSAAFQPHNG